MKYYVYISATKLDMLASQIPQRLLRRLSAELRIDVGIASIRVSGEPLSDTLYSKLALVERYIRKHEKVGSIESPDEYFEGNLGIQWGPLETMGWLGQHNEHGFWQARDSSMVYFAGARDTTVFGLAGSRKHLIGQTSMPVIQEGPTWWGGDSATPTVVRNLVAAIEGSPLEEWGDQWALEGVRHATATMKGPIQRHEFLAKRLLYGPVPEWWSFEPPDSERARGWRVALLGTPLYVALAE